MVLLQLGLVFPLFALVVLLLAMGVVYASVEIVDAGELRALLVFGEFRAVLVPGLNFVPPFVSETYPIDPATMTVEKASESFPVPEEFRDEVRDVAGIEAHSADREEGIETGTATRDEGIEYAGSTDE